MLDPLEWLPKVQANKLRFQQLLFETDTPVAAKEKLRNALPKGTSIVLYKNLEEFKAAFPNSINLQWMEHELSMLETGTVKGTGF